MRYMGFHSSFNCIKIPTKVCEKSASPGECSADIKVYQVLKLRTADTTQPKRELSWTCFIFP